MKKMFKKKEEKNLPSAIVFDIVESSSDGPNTAVQNVYTNFINNMYGKIEPSTEPQCYAIMNTLGFAFENRVKYLLSIPMVNVVNSITYTFTELRVMEGDRLFEQMLNEIMESLFASFDSVLVSMFNYVGDRCIVNDETIIHLIASMATSVNNIAYKYIAIAYKGFISAKDYSKLNDIVADFALELEENVFPAIFRDLDTVYIPQLEHCYDYIENSKLLEEDIIDGELLTEL